MPSKYSFAKCAALLSIHWLSSCLTLEKEFNISYFKFNLGVIWHFVLPFFVSSRPRQSEMLELNSKVNTDYIFNSSVHVDDSQYYLSTQPLFTLRHFV